MLASDSDIGIALMISQQLGFLEQDLNTHTHTDTCTCAHTQSVSVSV